MLDSFETPQEFCVVTEFAQVWIFNIVFHTKRIHFVFHVCSKILYFKGELFEVLEDDKCLPEEQVQAIAKQLVLSAKLLLT